MRNGYTLIEMMIVIAVIGIIMAFIVPNYFEYKKRTNRADVQAEMMNLAQRLESQKLATSKYPTGTTMATFYGGTSYPRTGVALFTLNFATLNDSTWVMTATPNSTGPQRGDGIICLNDQGHKFWAKGATDCALSATSNWDGR